jgi:hypothetical protein
MCLAIGFLEVTRKASLVLDSSFTKMREVIAKVTMEILFQCYTYISPCENLCTKVQDILIT